MSVVHQKNSELLCAHRATIKHGSGLYVVSLDSDDCLRPDALELLSGVVAAYAPDFILFPFSRSLDCEPFETDDTTFKMGYYEGAGCLGFHRSVFDGRHISVWCKCVKLSILDVTPDYSAYHGLTYAEDLFQLPELMALAHNFYYLDEAMYFHRDNSEGCTKLYKTEYLTGFSAALDIQMRYAESMGGIYPELARKSSIRHIGVLIDVLSKSPMVARGVVRELAAIRRYADEVGLFEPRVTGISLRRLVQARLLEKKRCGLLYFILRLYDELSSILIMTIKT